MKLWSARQLVALFLAVFVTVGTSLSAAQASDMTVKMEMAFDMGGSGHDPCQGCPAGGGDDGMKAISCAAICVAPMLAVLPLAEPVMLVHKTVSFMARYPLLNGKASPPEPYPPRPIEIG